MPPTTLAASCAATIEGSAEPNASNGKTIESTVAPTKFDPLARADQERPANSCYAAASANEASVNAITDATAIAPLAGLSA